MVAPVLSESRLRRAADWRNEFATAFLASPRVKAIALAALHKQDAPYDELYSLKADACMVLLTKYADVLDEPARMLTVTAEIMDRLAMRARVAAAIDARKISLSVMEGADAEALDFAAFGDYAHSVNEQQSTDESPPWAGISQSHAAAVALASCRDRLALRLTQVTRPDGVRAALVDDSSLPRTRAPAAAPFAGRDTPERARVMRLAVVTGLRYAQLRELLRWSTPDWNAMLNARERAVPRDLSALVALESTLLDEQKLAEFEMVQSHGFSWLLAMWARRMQIPSDSPEATVRALALRLNDRTLMRKSSPSLRARFSLHQRLKPYFCE